MTSEPALDVSGQDDNSSIGAKEEDEDDDDDEDLREDRFVLLFVGPSARLSLYPLVFCLFVSFVHLSSYLTNFCVCLSTCLICLYVCLISVVYFNLLLGAVRTRNLVKTLFFSCFQLFFLILNVFQ